MEAIKEYELNGYKVSIHQDTDAQSPDTWGNTDAFLVYDHRQFSVEQKGFSPEDINERLQSGKRTYNGYWAFPVYAYIHSGVSLSLGNTSYPYNDRWDTSMRGFALVKRQKGWTYKREQAVKVAQSIVEEWNQYLSGEVYGYIVADKDDNTLESCWGFYGDISYCESEAAAIVAYHVGNAFKQRINMVKAFIKYHIPLNIRQRELYENNA